LFLFLWGWVCVSVKHATCFPTNRWVCWRKFARNHMPSDSMVQYANRSSATHRNSCQSVLLVHVDFVSWICLPWSIMILIGVYLPRNRSMPWARKSSIFLARPASLELNIAK
jgi:hypothetical protein